MISYGRQCQLEGGEHNRITTLRKRYYDDSQPRPQRAEVGSREIEPGNWAARLGTGPNVSSGEAGGARRADYLGPAEQHSAPRPRHARARDPFA